MALIFADSFGHYEDATITRSWPIDGRNAASGLQPGSGQGRRGDYALVGNNNANGGLGRDLPASYTTLGIGFALRFSAIMLTATIGQHIFFRFAEGATAHMEICNGVGSRLAVRRAGATQLGSDTAPLMAAQWYYVEFKTAIHDTTGTVEVRVHGPGFTPGGEVVINLTNQDTRNAATGVINRLYAYVEAGTSSDVRIQDVVVWDTSGSVNNTFMGDVRVACLFPSGAGNSAQFTPLSSTNVSNVDEQDADEDTTYNSSTTPGNKDTFAVTDLPGAAASIKAVQQIVRARKTDAGARTLKQVVRRGGTDYEGATVNLGDAYAYFTEVLELDPSTSAAWTESNFNGAEFGYKDQA
jgi:hypothetical protein